MLIDQDRTEMQKIQSSVLQALKNHNQENEPPKQVTNRVQSDAQAPMMAMLKTMQNKIITLKNNNNNYSNNKSNKNKTKVTKVTS